jgi:hypothetical protein
MKKFFSAVEDERDYIVGKLQELIQVDTSIPPGARG